MKKFRLIPLIAIMLLLHVGCDSYAPSEVESADARLGSATTDATELLKKSNSVKFTSLQDMQRAGFERVSNGVYRRKAEDASTTMYTGLEGMKYRRTELVDQINSISSSALHLVSKGRSVATEDSRLAKLLADLEETDEIIVQLSSSAQLHSDMTPCFPFHQSTSASISENTSPRTITSSVSASYSSDNTSNYCKAIAEVVIDYKTCRNWDPYKDFIGSDADGFATEVSVVAPRGPIYTPAYKPGFYTTWTYPTGHPGADSYVLGRIRVGVPSVHTVFSSTDERVGDGDFTSDAYHQCIFGPDLPE